MSGDLEIRTYRPGDEQGILDGWNAIFPENDGKEARGLDYWNWAYRDNNFGRTEAAVALVDGRIVGQYAAIPQRAIDDGNDITIGLVVDSFVLPGYRRAGGGPGLIITLAELLHESWCSANATLVEEGHLLTHGYTTQLYRIAQGFLGSEMVRDMDILFRELHAAGYVSTEMPGDMLVDVVDTTPDEVDGVWEAFKPELAFGIVRDREYLDWRYTRHPLNEYRFLIARSKEDGTARGIAVYAKTDYGIPGVGTICDWIVPVAELEAEDAILSTAEELAREDGAPMLIAEFPQNDPRFLRWQRKGCLVAPPSQWLTMNTFRHSVLKLRDVWYHTLGDSDLV